MELREATRDDLAEILSLIGELAEYEHLADEVTSDEDEMDRLLFGARPVARVLLVVEGDAVAGFALWWPTMSTFLGRSGIWLEDLFLRPQYRGRGFGWAVLARLRSMTDGRIEWNVLDWNTPAISFYDRLGARPVPGWTTYRWLPGAAAAPDP